MSAPVTVGILVSCIALAVPVIAVATDLETRHRVAQVADSSALAAADALLGWIDGDPCPAAAHVAEHAGLRLVDCAVSELTVTVTVAAHGAIRPIAVSSRAGIAPSDLWK